MTEKKELHYESVVGDAAVIPSDMAVCMDKFARTFEASARRWELVVYPSLLAFIILASYGFYLIYNLTKDVGRLARSMETVVVTMDDVAANMNYVSRNVALISNNLTSISVDVGSQANIMGKMVSQMDTINHSMHLMTVPVYQMRNDLGKMSHNLHNVAGPMNMIGSILP